MCGARRYVGAWRLCSERGTTETLRSLRSSMLSWGRGGSAGSSKAPAPARPPRQPPAPLAPPSLSGDEFTDCEAVESSLLAGTTAVARRRHAIRLKRKSKITFRIIRSVCFPFCFSHQVLVLSRALKRAFTNRYYIL